jgi:hypothetical protein
LLGGLPLFKPNPSKRAKPLKRRLLTLKERNRAPRSEPLMLTKRRRPKQRLWMQFKP